MIRILAGTLLCLLSSHAWAEARPRSRVCVPAVIEGAGRILICAEPSRWRHGAVH